MRKVLIALVVGLFVAMTLGSSASARQRSPFPGDKLDLLAGSVAGPDISALVSGPSSVKGGKTAKLGPNVRVNAPQQGAPNGLFGRSETTVTNIWNTGNLVAGWNDAQGFCGPPFGSACTPQTPPGLSGYGYSTDGGATWTDGGGPDPFGGVLSRGDPWLDDNGSTVFYANLAVDATSAADLGIGVWRGDFAGGFAWDDVRVFNSPHAADQCQIFGGDPGETAPCDFYDKEAIVVGKGAFANDAYVSLTNFQELCGNAQFGFGQIEVWRTHDGGDTWQGPAIAGPEQPDSVADCGFTGTLQQSSAPAIGPNGHAYVVWQVGPFFGETSTGTAAAIAFSRSTDGGTTWSTPQTVANINSMRMNSPVAYNRSRINDHPRIDVQQEGKNKGRIFVTYYGALAPTGPEPPVACPPGTPSSTPFCVGQNLTSSQVYVKYSDNGGATWSAAKEVAPTPPATGVKRWWPDVVVDNKFVQVVYYESQEKQATADPSDTECSISIGSGFRRVGPNSSLVDTYWTYSTDGGNTWVAPIRVSTVTTNWCNVVSNIRPNMGDYNDTEAMEGHRIGTVWADGRNGVPDTFFAAGKAK